MHSFIARALEICGPALSKAAVGVFGRVFDAPYIPERQLLVCPPPVGRPTKLAADAEMAKRMGATVKAAALLEFEQRLRAPELLPEALWSEMSNACCELAKEVQRRVARMDPELARSAIAAAEMTYACRFVLGANESEPQLVRAVNLALREVVVAWGQILDGTTTIDELMPRPIELLPLACLGGTTPQRCLEDWRKRQPRQYSAEKKFARVAAELEEVLGGLQLEFMQPSHVERYVQRLVAKGLNPNTVANKVGVICTLVRNIDVPAGTRMALQQRRPRQGVCDLFRTRRRELTRDELGVLLSEVFNDRSLQPDDRVVAALQALTGARIEEVCSLDSEDVSLNGDSWTMHVRLSKGELDALAKWVPAGKTVPGVKTLESLRAIPFYADAVPGLHERLLELTQRPGPLFKHLWPTAADVRSSAVSRRINRRIRALFGEDCGIVFESLRNTAGPVLRRAGVGWDARRVFLGHAPMDVHDRHYDKLTTDDLRAAGRAVADAVRQALEGKEFPRLDVRYERCRRVLKGKRAVLNVDREACPMQQMPLDVKEREAISPTEAGFFKSTAEIGLSLLPVAGEVGGYGPDLNEEVRDCKVGPLRVDTSARCGERVRGLCGERDPIVFEQPRDDELGEAPHGTPSSYPTTGSPRTGHADGFHEPEPTSGLGRDAVGASPSLDAVEAATSLDEIIDVGRVPLVDIACVDQRAHSGKTTTGAEVARPCTVDAPQVAGDPCAARDEAVREVAIAHCVVGAVLELAAPAESGGDRALHAEHDGVVVGRARPQRPFGERRCAEGAHALTPLLERPAPVGCGGYANSHGCSPDRDLWEGHWEDDAPHCLRERREWYRAIATPGVAGVSGEVVAELFGHRCPAQRAERVAKGVENDATVRNATAILAAQIPSKPLQPIAASIAELVGPQIRKHPLVRGGAAQREVVSEPTRQQRRVQRHAAPRCHCLDMGLAGVIGDVHDQAVTGVPGDVGNAQLAELFESGACCEAQHGQPGGCLATPSAWTQAIAIYGRAEKRPELRRGELLAPKGRDALVRHAQTPGSVLGQAAGIDLGLQHGANEPDALADRRRREPVA